MLYKTLPLKLDIDTKCDLYFVLYETLCKISEVSINRRNWNTTYYWPVHLKQPSGKMANTNLWSLLWLFGLNSSMSELPVTDLWIVGQRAALSAQFMFYIVDTRYIDVLVL